MSMTPDHSPVFENCKERYRASPMDTTPTKTFSVPTSPSPSYTLSSIRSQDNDSCCGTGKLDLGQSLPSIGIASIDHALLRRVRFNAIWIFYITHFLAYNILAAKSKEFVIHVDFPLFGSVALCKEPQHCIQISTAKGQTSVISPERISTLHQIAAT